MDDKNSDSCSQEKESYIPKPSTIGLMNGGLMEDGYIMSKPGCFVNRFGKQIGPQGKGNVCENLSFYLRDRRSVGDQLNHGVVRLVNFCKRFVIIKGTECMGIDVCVVGGRLVNVIGCVIIGTASSDGGNKCGGLGTDGNKVGNRTSVLVNNVF
ncbi:hypothetical protein Tco_0919837 [Tanacetum coccineum]